MSYLDFDFHGIDPAGLDGQPSLSAEVDQAPGPDSDLGVGLGDEDAVEAGGDRVEFGSGAVGSGEPNPPQLGDQEPGVDEPTGDGAHLPTATDGEDFDEVGDDGSSDGGSSVDGSSDEVTEPGPGDDLDPTADSVPTGDDSASVPDDPSLLTVDGLDVDGDPPRQDPFDTLDLDS
jgi:hypothetical protein